MYASMNVMLILMKMNEWKKLMQRNFKIKQIETSVMNLCRNIFSSVVIVIVLFFIAFCFKCKITVSFLFSNHQFYNLEKGAGAFKSLITGTYHILRLQRQ
jgi:hypothetical protein